MTFVPEIDDQLETIITLINSNRVEGLEQLTALAQGGHRSAILYLGLYLSEERATTELALPWLVLADGFGSADAAWNIAMIARERGDLLEMKHWINRAADLGEDDAKMIRDNNYDMSLVTKEVKE